MARTAVGERATLRQTRGGGRCTRAVGVGGTRSAANEGNTAMQDAKVANRNSGDFGWEIAHEAVVCA